MIYLKTQDTNNGIKEESLFYCWGDVHRALFSPDVERVALVEFKTHGKTYAERREHLHNLAVTFSNACEGDLSWSEVNSIVTWFEKNGKRYGLMNEFHENGIC